MPTPTRNIDFTFCKGEGKAPADKHFICPRAHDCKRFVEYEQSKDILEATDPDTDGLISFASPYYCSTFGFTAYLNTSKP